MYSIVKRFEKTYKLDAMREKGRNEKVDANGNQADQVWRVLELAPITDEHTLTAANGIIKPVIATDTGKTDEKGYTVYSGTHRTLMGTLDKLGDKALGRHIPAEIATIKTASSFYGMIRKDDGTYERRLNEKNEPVLYSTFDIILLEGERADLESAIEARLRSIIRQKEHGGGFLKEYNIDDDLNIIEVGGDVVVSDVKTDLENGTPTEEEELD